MIKRLLLIIRILTYVVDTEKDILLRLGNISIVINDKLHPAINNLRANHSMIKNPARKIKSFISIKDE